MALLAWNTNITNYKKHTVSLDGMRGLAVLFVFMSHTSGREMPIASWLNFHGIGHIGVYLFFVLSGFLLTQNLLRGQKTVQYFSRRFFRIAPLYFFVLICVVAYQTAGNYSSNYLNIKGGWEGVLLHFLFLKGDSIFWTIAAEFAFYLMLPFVVVAISRFGQKWLAVMAGTYFLWFIMIQIFDLPLKPLKFVLITHNSQFLDVFALGILGAYVQKKLPENIVAIFFWATLGVTLLCISKNFLGFGQPLYDLRWASLLYGVVFAAAIVSVSQGNRWLCVPLQNKFMVFMGLTGFGWYLLHFPVIQAVNFYLEGTSSGLRFLTSIVISSILAWASFHAIERPGISLGRKFESYLHQQITDHTTERPQKTKTTS